MDTWQRQRRSVLVVLDWPLRIKGNRSCGGRLNLVKMEMGYKIWQSKFSFHRLAIMQRWVNRECIHPLNGDIFGKIIVYLSFSSSKITNSI